MICKQQKDLVDSCCSHDRVPSLVKAHHHPSVSRSSDGCNNREKTRSISALEGKVCDGAWRRAWVREMVKFLSSLYAWINKDCMGLNGERKFVV